MTKNTTHNTSIVAGIPKPINKIQQHISFPNQNLCVSPSFSGFTVQPFQTAWYSELRDWLWHAAFHWDLRHPRPKVTLSVIGPETTTQLYMEPFDNLMTLVLGRKKAFFLGGWPLKIEVNWVPGVYMYIYIYVSIYIYIHIYIYTVHGFLISH